MALYCYIYDSRCRERKYEGMLARLEARVTDLGIAGRINRLSAITSAKEMIARAVREGATTVVAVGTDDTVSRVVAALPSTDLVVGYVPLIARQPLAAFLGIPEGEGAADVLSARIVRRIDIGRANDIFFLHQLEVVDGNATVLCNNQYAVRSLEPSSSITIQNFGPTAISNPEDGRLETVFAPAPAAGISRLWGGRGARPSVFSIKRAVIQSDGESLRAVADGSQVVKTPLTIEVVPKRLKVIVGKHRAF